MPSIVSPTPDPDTYPSASIVAPCRDEDAPPPMPLLSGGQPTPPHRLHTPRPPAHSLLTGKGRHVVTGGTAVAFLGMGGVAYALDPAALDPSSPLMLAPVFTLAAQAVMALIGYLRDYGAERLEAERDRGAERLEIERARVAEAREGRRVAEAEAAALREELRRREEREDAEREARYTEALEEIKRLRGA
jgi:hypothetical protein